MILKESLSTKVVKSHIYGIIKNVLPTFSVPLSVYNTLLKSAVLKNYFKRFYPLQRMVNIEKFLKRSHLYNKKFYDKVSSELANSRELFLKNVENAVSLMSVQRHVKLTQYEHDYAVGQICKYIFCNCSTYFRPETHQVIETMNLNASSGLPTPWYSKRRMLPTILQILESVRTKTFDLVANVTEISREEYPMTSAFMRMQITNSGLKMRLVFAVSLIFVTVETYFNTILKYLIYNVNSCAIHGFTQPEIGKLAMSTKDKHTLCIDYKSFDQRIPSFVILTVMTICIDAMRLNLYEERLFRQAIYFSVTMPTFHPDIAPQSKAGGITSGCGLTSILGSLCNSYMLHASIARYCRTHNIKNYNNYRVYVSSDDTIISSEFYIDFKQLSAIMNSLFTVEVELESYSKPGKSSVFFLGSEWIDGFPYRKVDRMLARIIFGSGNYPKMSDLELFQSRCFEILGNTAQYHEIYKTFNIPYPNRVFRFLELADFSNQKYIKSNLESYERRGFWEDIQLNSATANYVWMDR